MKKLHILKGLTIAVFAFCLLLSLVACGELGIVSFTVVQSSVKTEYFEGEAIDFSGIKAHIKYNDESLNTELFAKDLKVEYDNDITAVAGSKTVKVSYTCPHTGETKTAEVAIYVKEDPNAIKHEGYRIDVSSVKTSYLLGEETDFTGLKLFETFTGGAADVEITDLTGLAFDMDDAVTATAGIKTVTVTYNGDVVGTFTVTVKDPDDERNLVESFEIEGNYKNVFEKGDTVEKTDFTGLSLVLTYEDGEERTVALADIVMKGTVDTSATGKKTVRFECSDPINGETVAFSVEITVVAKKPVVNGFEEPNALSEFKQTNASVGNKEYGEVGFSSQFEKKAVYVIGDDNKFKLVPTLTVMDDGQLKSLTAFYSKVSIAVKNGTEYVPLTEKVADSLKQTIVSYYEGEVLIATVDTYRGEYQFTADAVGKEIKISVLPDDTHYDKTANATAVTLEAKVIDAYNVYEAWQLAVIDDRSGVWDNFKAEKGLEGVRPAAVVLHNDIHIGKDDVPQDFFYTAAADIIYTNSVTGETKTVLAGTKYLKDETEIYVRRGEGDFLLEGNFFTVDVMNFPLVPSPDAYDKCGGADTQYAYWGDFSNASLFIFESYAYGGYGTTASTVPHISIKNLSFIGNAGRDSLLDAKGELVSAGGLIFLKSRNNAQTAVENTNVVSSFIAMFSDMDATLSLDAVKCYDSYQNALFLWGKTECTVVDSYLVGAGGPLVLLNSVYRKELTPQWYHAVLDMTNTETESRLTGQELWFASLGATPIVQDQVAPLLQGLSQAGVDQFILDSKMNIVAALITNAGSGTDDLSAIVGNVDLEGNVSVNGSGLERWKTEALWASIYNHPAFQNSAPFLTVVDEQGNDQIIFFNGSAFCDAQGRVLGTDASHAALMAAFAGAEYLTLTQGGMTIVFAAVK